MAESARMVWVEPQRRVTLPEVAWESVSDPGAVDPSLRAQEKE